MKGAAKAALYRTGLARQFHARRNSCALTVAMFHRVLPADDPRYEGADPVYTVTPEEFETCLELFETYYSVVPLKAVDAAAHGGPALPERALLITFDDGWRDVIEYAAPLLQRRRLPSVLFVATAHVGSDEGFLPEMVLDWALTDEGPVEAKLERIGADASAATEMDRVEAARQVAAALADAPEDRRREVVREIRERQRETPQAMADAADLEAFAQSGGVVGGHGHSHDPLTAVDCVTTEINQCKDVLDTLDAAPNRPPFSFPHGRYEDALIEKLKQADFGLVFTSESGLAPYPSLGSHRPIPRVEINLENYRRRGRLDIPAFAFHLFTQPHKA